MSIKDTLARGAATLKGELAELAQIKKSDRPWQMPVAAALASGLPIAVGAWFDHLDYGIVSSLGGMVFLYLPATPLHHRMVWLMACAFGMSACYTLGLFSHFFPPLVPLVLAFIAIIVNMICRFFLLGPPGSMFFLMAAAIGAYTPADVLQLPVLVGLLTMGGLLAALVALAYSLYILRHRPAAPVVPVPPATFDAMVFDPVVIGVGVGVSLALGQALDMPSPYWVPVSCLAVVQGLTLRSVWTRQVERVLGTGVGLLVAWGLLSLPLDKWSICLMMTALAFVIETMVVRHYGLAVVFITPLTIFLAEAATFGHGLPADALIRARFFDTLLGCAVGLGVGLCLHSPRFRAVGGGLLRRMIPSGLLP
jgi:hypothetical protein